MITDKTFLLYTGGNDIFFLNNILDINSNNNNNENNELPLICRSSYYDFDKFYSVAKNNNKHFSILSSNIQSIKAKFSELEAFVNFKFSIICLQESWLSDTDDLSLIQLSGYDCISQEKAATIKVD